jgi:hypothetical protein
MGSLTTWFLLIELAGFYQAELIADEFDGLADVKHRPDDSGSKELP